MAFLSQFLQLRSNQIQIFWHGHTFDDVVAGRCFTATTSILFKLSQRPAKSCGISSAGAAFGGKARTVGASSRNENRKSLRGVFFTPPLSFPLWELAIFPRAFRVVRQFGEPDWRQTPPCARGLFQEHDSIVFRKPFSLRGLFPTFASCIHSVFGGVHIS